MRKEIEEKLLKRSLMGKNSFVSDLIFYTSLSTVYEFKNAGWVQLKIEGTFVMYKRKEKYFCNKEQVHLKVFNRKSLKDFEHVITDDMSFYVQDNIIIFQENSIFLFGLWFPDHKTTMFVYKLMCKEKNVVNIDSSIHLSQNEKKKV